MEKKRVHAFLMKIIFYKIIAEIIENNYSICFNSGPVSQILSDVLKYKQLALIFNKNRKFSL